MESETFKFVMDEDVSLSVFSFSRFIKYFPYVAKLIINDQYIQILCLLKSEGLSLENTINKQTSRQNPLCHFYLRWVSSLEITKMLFSSALLYWNN
jgi:hypothetical protein